MCFEYICKYPEQNLFEKIAEISCRNALMCGLSLCEFSELWFLGVLNDGNYNSSVIAYGIMKSNFV